MIKNPNIKLYGFTKLLNNFTDTTKVSTGPCNGCIFSSTDGWHCTASEEEQENIHLIVNTKNNTTRCSGYISLPEKEKEKEN